MLFSNRERLLEKGSAQALQDLPVMPCHPVHSFCHSVFLRRPPVPPALLQDKMSCKSYCLPPTCAVAPVMNFKQSHFPALLHICMYNFLCCSAPEALASRLHVPGLQGRGGAGCAHSSLCLPNHLPMEAQLGGITVGSSVSW